MKGAQADMKQVFFDALHKKGIIPEQELSMETLGRIFGPLQKQVIITPKSHVSLSQAILRTAISESTARLYRFQSFSFMKRK